VLGCTLSMAYLYFDYSQSASMYVSYVYHVMVNSR
jgi:hypothetical protein